ncbi:MAG: hypothetical protein IT233_13190 [Bacteroidia bacterium]|nr:hypothetical protein [Bacteroidia bacterium]
MKKQLFLMVVLVLGLGFTAFKVVQKAKDICNPVEMKKKTKSSLDPFKYDSAKLTRINWTKKPMKISTEVPLSLFGKYRLVFNTEGMPKKIGINVYNKSRDNEKRDVLFSNKDSLDNNTTLIYNPTKHTRKVYIDYDVPADTLGLKIKGCVYMVLGYD